MRDSPSGSTLTTRVSRSASLYLCLVTVEGWQVSPSPSTVKLPLAFVDWMTPTPSDWESALETLEIRHSLETLETLETLALLESPCSLRQA